MGNDKFKKWCRVWDVFVELAVTCKMTYMDVRGGLSTKSELVVLWSLVLIVTHQDQDRWQTFPEVKCARGYATPFLSIRHRTAPSRGLFVYTSWSDSEWKIGWETWHDAFMWPSHLFLVSSYRNWYRFCSISQIDNLGDATKSSKTRLRITSSFQYVKLAKMADIT